MRRTPEEIKTRHEEIRVGFEAALPAELRLNIKLGIMERHGNLTKVTVWRTMREQPEREGSGAEST